MTRRTRVKICGLRDEASVEVACDAGVDAVGFVLAASPRRVEPGRAAELVARVPNFISAVMVHRHPRQEEAEHAVRTLPHSVHQSDLEDFDGALGSVPVRRRLMVVRCDDRFEARMDSLVAGARSLPVVLVEGVESGVGARADWDRIAAYSGRARIVLAGGLSAENVGEAVRRVRPYGVDVSSGVESSRGVKDAGLMRGFVEAVRAADRGEEV